MAGALVRSMVVVGGGGELGEGGAVGGWEQLVTSGARGRLDKKLGAGSSVRNGRGRRQATREKEEVLLVSATENRKK